MSGYLDQPAAGLAILLWAAGPDDPARLATPFFHAAAAAALELPVEMYFSARSVHLLLPGVAAGLRPSPHVDRSIDDAMQAALGHGVRFFVCSDALQAQGLAGRALIAGCSGHGGALQFQARAADLRWRALVF